VIQSRFNSNRDIDLLITGVRQLGFHILFHLLLIYYATAAHIFNASICIVSRITVNI